MTHIDYIQASIISFHVAIDNEKRIKRAERIDQEIGAKIDLISESHKKWDEELNRLEEVSKNLRYKLNFVGLSSAYHDLLEKKNKEMVVYFISMLLFFVCMILTPIFVPIMMEAAGYVTYDHTNPVGGLVLWSNLTSRLAVSAPFFLLLLYAFRICLRNFQSVRGQIVQLQIRQAICQFVEAYSDFVGQKSSILKDSGEHLKKFESLIFAGLTPDPDSIPSTFDGLDQIIEAVKAIRK